MNSDNTPAHQEPAVTPVILPLTESNKTQNPWTLTLRPTHLELADAPGAQPYIILRQQLMKSAILMERIRVLTLKEPRKVTFKLSPEATATLADWIGKSILAGHYLKQRYGFTLPIAVLWIFTSMPLAETSPGSGNALPFDLIGFSLGATLVVMWAWAKWRPHPSLFLMDSIWFLVLAVKLVVDVANGWNKGWLVLVVFLLWMCVSGVKHFLRFRGIDMQQPSN